MGINIKMFPASYGDSFFISFKESEKNEFNLLVDTGFSTTYNSYLKSFFSQLKTANRGIDLLVITHIDNDHIRGALKLIPENGDANNPHLIPIGEIWHNSYRHLMTGETQLVANLNKIDKKIIKQIEALGYVRDNEDRDVNPDIAAKEGSSLAKLINHYGYNWNITFDEKAVKCDGPIEIILGSNIRLILLSPDNEKLEALRKYWSNKLVEMGYLGPTNIEDYFDDAFEFIVSREKLLNTSNKDISSKIISILEDDEDNFTEDTSSTNGSSIAFALEFDDKKLLFLADSHPKIIEENLKSYYQEEKLWFDLIKISHHGSKFNTSASLLNLIDSDKYLISTNSKLYNHPDIETISRIVRRPTATKREILFNYKNHLFDFLNNEELKCKYNYDIKIEQEIAF